jgi:cell division septal protein FtsQ
MKLKLFHFQIILKRLFLQLYFTLKKLRGLIILAGIVIFLTALIMNMTTIRHIEAKGLDAIITIDTNMLPNNLLFFPSERVKQLLLKEYPFVRDVTIEKKYPDTLVLHFEPRKPIARIVTPERSVSVSEDGMVLADTNVQEYTAIFTSSLPLSVGNQLRQTEIRNALAFLAQMPQDEDIQSIMIDDAGVLQVTLPATFVVLSQTKDGGESARTLQSVLTGFRIKGSVPKRIDLRFEQPVVAW